eukprot:TRINITY_DN17510_c0_g1_i3.p2 TRINITY_DN17510_c0_g1~~TRINITY_DN17510_c0_g1_i3.p2  ORF type:complete len:356 (-),score=39.93 TRINITY_DN17510_c0_g1_i3:69-1136(-)
MNANEVAIVMWSLKQLRFFDNSLFNQIEDLISSQKWRLSSQNISNICLALATFRQNADGELIKVLTNQFINIRNYEKQHIVNVIYSLSVMGCKTSIVQQIVDKMVENCSSPKRRKYFNKNRYDYNQYDNSFVNNNKIDGSNIQNSQQNDLQHNSNVNDQNDENFAKDRPQQNGQIKEYIQDQLFDLEQRELCQLRWSYLLYQIPGKEKLIFPQVLIKQSMLAQQQHVKETLYRENDLLPKVYAVVKRKYPYAQERVLICNGEMQVHICICGHSYKHQMRAHDVYDVRQRKVALEIFTTKSFVLNRDSLVVGYALSKLELLVGFGWRIVIVSSYEWDDEGYQEKMLKVIEKAISED